MIPKQIHFVLASLPDFPIMPFEYIHYLVVKSAAIVNDCPIYCHCDMEPAGEHWKNALRFMKPVFRPTVREIAGIPIQHPIQCSDLQRLQILHEKGGIYIDFDVLCARPFGELLANSCVLGREAGGTICAGVILAEPQSEFLKLWIDGYDPKTSLLNGFRSTGVDRHYYEMSTEYATLLGTTRGDLVTILDENAFHFPSRYRDIDSFFFKTIDTTHDHYCFHLFYSRHWHFLRSINDGIIHGSNTYFHNFLKRIVLH